MFNLSDVPGKEIKLKSGSLKQTPVIIITIIINNNNNIVAIINNINTYNNNNNTATTTLTMHYHRYLLCPLIEWYKFYPFIHLLKVLIQETEEQRFLGVGVVWKDYGNHAMPGQTKRTVGYHVDQGKILGPFKPVNLAGKEYEGNQKEINVAYGELYVNIRTAKIKKAEAFFV